MSRVTTNQKFFRMIKFLRSVKNRLIGHLSKGFRQRVAIAQALVHSPQVLILDEPTSGLDPGQRKEIRELIKELSAGDATVVLSTHVLPEVEAVCDRVVIIHHGRIVAEDALADLTQLGTAVALRVARPSPELVGRLSNLEGVVGVSEDGGRVQVRARHDVREQAAAVAVDYGLLELVAERGLEDLFLQLTAEA